MISLKDTLNTLKAKFEIELPALLYDADVSDFDVYHIGSSRDPKQRGLFLYQDNINLNYSRHSISIIVHLQLFEIDEEEAAIYNDVIKDYLWSLDLEDLKFDLLENINCDSYYDVNEMVAYSYIVVSWSVENSDCDL